MIAYKFRAASQISYAFDILLYQRLYCSEWKNLNDPMEGVYAYSHPTGEETLVERIVKGISESKRRYKVCSLAGTFDCHLLWAHYAGGFDGVAIEVELPDDDQFVRRVRYRGVFDYVDFNNITAEDEAAQRILFSKYQEWSYEEEVRILSENSWYQLDRRPRRVIAGPRMSEALFDVMNMTCERLDIRFCKVGIGDDGIDADFVEPPIHRRRRRSRRIVG